MNVHYVFFLEFRLYCRLLSLIGAEMPYLTKTAPCPEPIDCKILTAALDLFVTRGFHNVSIHDVQKTANVSIGSIYNHFGGKEGIAKALYSHLLNEMSEFIDSVITEVDGAINQCNRIIQLLFEYTETQPNIISYVLYSKHSEYIADGSPICSAEPFVKMRKIIQSGINNGEINASDCMIASAVIYGGAIRMIQFRLDGLINKPLPELYDELISTTWCNLAIDPAPDNKAIKKIIAEPEQLAVSI